MYLNRLCIDEEAAFESTGVYSLKELEQIIMWQEMRRLAENKSEDLTLHFVYTVYWLLFLGRFILAGMKKTQHQGGYDDAT